MRQRKLATLPPASAHTPTEKIPLVVFAVAKTGTVGYHRARRPFSFCINCWKFSVIVVPSLWRQHEQSHHDDVKHLFLKNMEKMIVLFR